MGLLPYAWRSLAARRWRTLLTIVGVALGVAVLAASLVTSSGIDRAIDRTVTDVAGQADLSVTAFGEGGLSADAIRRVAELPGVAVAAPVVERRTYLSPGLATGDWTTDPVAVVGIDPAIDGRVRSMPLVAGTGLGSRTAAEAIVSESFATASGLQVGDQMELFGAADAAPDAGRFTIVGVIAGDGPVIGAGGRVIVVPVDRARALFAIPGATRVDVVATDRGAAAAIRAALPDTVGEAYVLSTRADLAASLQASTEAFRTTMALVAAIALFTGAFLIFNTLSMTVTERVREVALLRAAGASPRQVTRVVLVAALVIGVAGSALGVLLGIGLAVALTGFVRDAFGLRTEVAPDAYGIALVLLLGLLVTIAAALEPAFRAGRVPPVEALRMRATPGVEGRARVRWLVVVAAVVALAGAVLWPRPAGATDDPTALRPFAVYGLLLIVALALPFVLPPLARLAGIPFAWLLKVEERLARGALVRDRSRTGLTVGALTIGLALVVAIGAVALEARQAATAWIDGVVPGDLVLSSVTPADLGAEGPTGDIAAVDGVARVSPIAVFGVAHDGLRLDAAAVRGADLAADGRLTFTAGDRAEALRALDAGGSVILPQAVADRTGLGIGSTITLASAGGTPVDLRVVGIVQRGFPGRGGEALLVGWPDATASFGVTGADLLAVRLTGDTAAARTAVEGEARQLGLQPVSLDRIEGAIGTALGRVFGLFDLLAIVAVIVAALGIVNTLSMDVVERVREIGILRATGMTRRQVARSVMVEAGMLGLVGAVLGIATGLVVAVAMVVLTGGRLDGGFAIPWPTVGLALILGIGLAMVAGYYPARLAGRQSIVRAVRAE